MRAGQISNRFRVFLIAESNTHIYGLSDDVCQLLSGLRIWLGRGEGGVQIERWRRWGRRRVWPPRKARNEDAGVRAAKKGRKESLFGDAARDKHVAEAVGLAGRRRATGAGPGEMEAGLLVRGPELAGEGDLAGFFGDRIDWRD